MADFDFPASPTNGQIYVANDRTFEYNSAKQRWESITTTGAQGLQGIQGIQAVNIVPLSGTKSSSYTLETGDIGDFVSIETGGSIIIPSGVFAAGDVITIFNNTASSATITSSAVTSYISGANVNETIITIFTRGLCTILFVGSDTCVVSGAVA